MFVRQSKYEEMLRRALQAEMNAEFIKEQWNKLVRQINAKGGQFFLDNASLNPASPLNEEELTKLIMLCHPDKHDGKPMATEMTQKLLKLKEHCAK